MERNIKITLEQAREWYKIGSELKTLALKLFSEQELNENYIPHKGDYVKYIDKYGNYIIQIYDVYVRYTNYIGLEFYHCETERYFDCGYIYFTPATPDDIKLLDDALTKVNKKFNKETFEIEYIVKVGDIIIAWNREFEHEAIIGPFIKYNKHYYVANNTFSDMVKFTSIEQYYNIIGKKNQ